jgi:hypothetical protein
MATNEHLKLQRMGSNLIGIVLKGNPKKPESDVCVKFPGGQVEISRCTDNTYWIHVVVNNEQRNDLCPGEFEPARVTEGRMDIIGKEKINLGDLGDNGLYHLAVRVSRQ